MPAMKKNRKHVVACSCEVVQENIFRIGLTKKAEYSFGSCAINTGLVSGTMLVT